MTIDLNVLNAGLAAMRGVQADRPFGPEPLVYKVGGKVFAMVADTDAGGRVTLKCDPVLAEALREAYPGVTPGYHTNKRHWNTVNIDGSVPDEVLWNMAQASYEIVVRSLPRAIRAGLG